MNKPPFYPVIFIWALLLFSTGAIAQDAASRGYSLQQAVDFALANNVNVKNAQVDVKSSNARVGEVRAIGLPQVSGQAQLIHNIEIQNVILEVGAGPSFGGDPTAPQPPVGTPYSFPFQLKNNAVVSVNANQLLFDGSYFIGLKAASTYKELARKNLNQSKIQTVEAVTKAYYGVLVNRERLELLDLNVKYLDTLVRETKAMYDNGFVEKIDVDRLEVQLNNLDYQQQQVDRLQELSLNLLKFQMGLDMKQNIQLTDSLYFEGIENFTVDPVADFDYSQRNEYSLLQTQKELAYLDVRNNRSQYLPQLAAFGTFGYNPAATKLSNITQKERWIDYSFVGLQLNVPIFDGLSKHYKIQQAKLAYEKTNQNMSLLQNSIDLEIRQATITLTNNLDALKSQKRNLDLAAEIVRVTRIKYQQGVGSNIEVNNAITAYKEAETNYYSALYDALIAKVDLDKATGKLLAE
ncbi:TolC family protein [Rhodocytophaga aerolata]|uniref:TolC family protein n=1 Tax=Rhodocytophaga aerolata TaxID=455078 RepID=A0ABT8RGB1_9BACT|nr:TolC family protein [Rhodocytophaga aerolata]MDO1451146.1 TolC family protein [Rhodocytophaga aerolata]